MAPKIIAAIITLLINIGAGIALFFFLILALNGYHENDAVYGLGAFAIVAGLVTISTTAAAFVAAHQLIRNNFKSLNAALLATLVFSILGAVLIMFGVILGVGVAHFVSLNY
jgi:hypothetical protein